MNLNSEIVVAKRRTRNDSLLKKSTAWIFYRILSLLGLPKESHDSGDFRLISKRVKDLLLAQPQSLQYLRGQLFTLNIPKEYITINRGKRIAGSTKYSLSKMLRLATSSAYVIDPIAMAQIYIVFALLSVLTCFLAIFIFIIVKLISPGYFSPGITTISIILLFLFSVAITILSAQGVYMSLVFRNLRNDPIYIEKQIN